MNTPSRNVIITSPPPHPPTPPWLKTWSSYKHENQHVKQGKHVFPRAPSTAGSINKCCLHSPVMHSFLWPRVHEFITDQCWAPMSVWHVTYSFLGSKWKIWSIEGLRDIVAFSTQNLTHHGSFGYTSCLHCKKKGSPCLGNRFSKSRNKASEECTFWPICSTVSFMLSQSAETVLEGSGNTLQASGPVFESFGSSGFASLGVSATKVPSHHLKSKAPLQKVC